ncbi:MAG: pentapeptide repeat-containing protein [Flavobacteriaceae bacterium]|nr:pentapeptide repeat-containing protein [Flavobacteriaceae bacterium]
MDKPLIVDKEFTNKSDLPLGEYDECTFIQCNFSGKELSHSEFLNCEFIDCDLSNVKLIQAAFREVSFENCKLLGLHFENCNEFLFSVAFNRCQLQLSSFYQCSLKNTKFRQCKLNDVDFTEANLEKASLDRSNLEGAIFEQTNLVEADFRNAINYTIDPEQNKLKKTKFSKEAVFGLLNKYDLIIE